MPKSRALKTEVEMSVRREDTPRGLMNEAKDTMTQARNSMMRGSIMMLGAQAMIAKKKKQKQKGEEDEMMEYSDLGGLNFNPKKFKRRKK